MREKHISCTIFQLVSMSFLEMLDNTNLFTPHSNFNILPKSIVNMKNKFVLCHIQKMVCHNLGVYVLYKQMIYNIELISFSKFNYTNTLTIFHAFTFVGLKIYRMIKKNIIIKSFSNLISQQVIIESQSLRYDYRKFRGIWSTKLNYQI